MNLLKAKDIEPGKTYKYHNDSGETTVFTVHEIYGSWGRNIKLYADWHRYRLNGRQKLITATGSDTIFLPKNKEVELIA